MTGLYEAPSVDDKAIWDLWLSMHHMPAASAGDELGLFDALFEKPATCAELAARLNLNVRALSVVLSLLCALGLVARKEGVYQATPVAAAYLRRDSAYYWGPLFSTFKNGSLVHNDLIALLKTGTTDQTGRPSKAWEAGEIEEETARGVAKFMHAHSLPAAISAARSGVYAGVKKMLDVGGGSGVYAIAAAQRHPDLRASIMDLKAMCKAAMDFVRDAGVEGRVDAVAVDMFREAWPSGYDAVFFSNVFHDWDDEINMSLAKKSFDILPPGGKIFLHEMLMNDNEDGPLTTASFSVLMLRGTKGKQYTLAELTAFLESAGFRSVTATQTSHYYSVVSAVKP
ncbi:MAG: methyltransferase [Parvularculaceae bacterium]